MGLFSSHPASNGVDGGVLLSRDIKRRDLLKGEWNQ